MPFIKKYHLPRVTHIGHLDRAPEDLTPSRDGPAIAVSDRPEVWRQITRANAPEITLYNSAALWVDALAFTANCIDEIREWAIDQGYIRACQVWHATWIDDDTGALRDSTRSTYEAALKDAGGADAVMKGEGFSVSPRALKRLGRWPDILDWYGAAITLYTREVIIPKRPQYVGIWWREIEDPDAGTAPSGQVFPEALKNFDVEDEFGDMIPFEEAFPDFTAIGARPVTLKYEDNDA